MTSRALLRSLIAFQMLTFSAAAVAQEGLLSQQTSAGVRDGAGMFSEAAIRQAGDTLRKVAHESGVIAVVETVGSLSGEAIDEAAIRMARRSAIKGIYILVAKKEMKLEVLASRPFHEAFPRETLHGLRTAFSGGFRKDDFDQGLREGVAAISAAVATAKAEKKLPASVPPIDESPGPLAAARTERATSTLVARDQIKLTLEGARVILEAAERKAAAMGLKSDIAVVDDGGHLLSFDRMNGARPASAYTAVTKAVSAATFRQATGPIPPGASNPDPILNLGLENAAAASGGRLTMLRGGLPVIVDGQVVGGVGAGGGSGEQDAEVVRAGIDAFLKQLESPEQTAGEDGKPTEGKEQPLKSKSGGEPNSPRVKD